MGFEANDHKIQDLLVGKQIYSTPRNQRKYVWNQDNWQELFDDIIFYEKVGDGK